MAKRISLTQYLVEQQRDLRRVIAAQPGHAIAGTHAPVVPGDSSGLSGPVRQLAATVPAARKLQ
jgi:hypothetical protein